MFLANGTVTALHISATVVSSGNKILYGSRRYPLADMIAGKGPDFVQGRETHSKSYAGPVVRYIHFPLFKPVALRLSLLYVHPIPP